MDRTIWKWCNKKNGFVGATKQRCVEITFQVAVVGYLQCHEKNSASCVFSDARVVKTSVGVLCDE